MGTCPKPVCRRPPARYAKEDIQPVSTWNTNHRVVIQRERRQRARRRQRNQRKPSSAERCQTQEAKVCQPWLYQFRYQRRTPQKWIPGGCAVRCPIRHHLYLGGNRSHLRPRVRDSESKTVNHVSAWQGDTLQEVAGPASERMWLRCVHWSTNDIHAELHPDR